MGQPEDCPQGSYSDFLDSWEKAVAPPALGDQAAELLAFSEALKVWTPAAKAKAEAEWRAMLSYRHVFS